MLIFYIYFIMIFVFVLKKLFLLDFLQINSVERLNIIYLWSLLFFSKNSFLGPLRAHSTWVFDFNRLKTTRWAHITSQTSIKLFQARIIDFFNTYLLITSVRTLVILQNRLRYFAADEFIFRQKFTFNYLLLVIMII